MILIRNNFLDARLKHKFAPTKKSMITTSAFDIDIKNKSKKMTEGIKYSHSFFSKDTSQGPIRSYAVERNNIWRAEMNKFVGANCSTTCNGKINNNYYRHKFKYDVIVPHNVYAKLLEHYRDLKISGDEDRIVFFEKYIDHIMMFCQAVNYYKGRYISYSSARKDKTPLYVKLIYSLVGREYQKILNVLKSLDIIDVDMTYLPAYLDMKQGTDKKGMCRHYNFKIELDERYVVYQITNRVIITKAYDSGENYSDTSYSEGGAKSIIKDSEANEYFSKNFELSKNANRKEDYDGFSAYFMRLSPDGDKFKNQSIGRDKFGNRLYHPFCYMKTGLRQYIEINGNTDTTKIDLNNSHPYFFSMLFDLNFISHVSHLLTEGEIELLQSIVNNPLFFDKIKLFKQITSSGCYYDFLKENIDTDWDTKVMNMCYFYGKFNKRNYLYRFFDKNFNFVNIVKYNIIKQGGYKRLSQILQRVESFVMIDGVFSKLRKLNLNVIPLHDCIMCSSSDKEIVKRVMIEEFLKIGVEYLPKFDKAIKSTRMLSEYEKIKEKDGSVFLNKGILFEKLNEIIKAAGIKNRVFKEGMKSESITYIDMRFEDKRELIDDEVANAYYDLRIKLDLEQFDLVDYKNIFELYKKTNMTKKKWYARNVTGQVKINPIEFFNHLYGSSMKTRVKESNYVY